MDINLRGGQDGLSLTKHLRESKIHKKTPIIAITAFGKYYEDDAISAGCNYFLIKPFGKNEFMELVSRSLQIN